jgi:UPF0755 protein
MRKYLFAFIVLFFVIGGVYSLNFSVSSNFKNRLALAVTSLFEAEFYESLANPSVAYVKVQEGLRKEELAMKLADRFDWDQSDIEDFYAYDQIRDRKFEGRYFPDTYLVPKEVSGKEMRELMTERFNLKIANLKKQAEKKNLNFDSVIIIASIIQREATATDMKLISGVIWNRIFSGMKLQMDATLQYAKATEENWWPRVVPEDKKIASVYNTYKNIGLPPSPIANPGLAAIEATINYQKTPCFYYFHKNRKIYCSKTYAEHKSKIDTYLIGKN